METQALYRVDITGDGSEYSVLQNSTEQHFSPSAFSVPEHIHFPAERRVKGMSHGFYWAPQNPKFQGRQEGKPRL